MGCLSKRKPRPRCRALDCQPAPLGLEGDGKADTGAIGLLIEAATIDPGKSDDLTIISYGQVVVFHESAAPQTP